MPQASLLYPKMILSSSMGRMDVILGLANVFSMASRRGFHTTRVAISGTLISGVGMVSCSRWRPFFDRVPRTSPLAAIAQRDVAEYVKECVSLKLVRVSSSRSCPIGEPHTRLLYWNPLARDRYWRRPLSGPVALLGPTYIVSSSFLSSNTWLTSKAIVKLSLSVQ